MVLECSRNLGGYGAAIKRLSRGKRKRRDALCTIHTMGVGNSRCCGAMMLDGFMPGQPAGAVIRRSNSGNMTARTEPYPAPGIPIPEARLSPVPRSRRRIRSKRDRSARSGPLRRWLRSGRNRCRGQPGARTVRGRFSGSWREALGQAVGSFCEAPHIRAILFAARWRGTGGRLSDWYRRGLGKDRQWASGC